MPNVKVDMAGSLPLLVAYAALLVFCDASIILRSRIRRQIGTVVKSDANTEGKGDDVLTNATAHIFKGADGTVDLGISSSGNAMGADLSSIQNQALGQVGGSGLSATGNVESSGQKTLSASEIAAAVHGDERMVSTLQKGEASGTGDTLVKATGGAVMSNYDLKSPYSGDNAVATAGATGSIKSLAEVLSKQELTWDNILVHVIGSAAAEGIGHAQANLDLGAGNANNGIEVNGLVSGVNTEGGNVNTQVNGSATMNGGQHDLTGNMHGSVNGASGNSTLLGATNIQSNHISGNSSVSSFADSKVHSDGSSSINLNGETVLNTEKGNGGKVGTNATAEGTNHHMTVQNGLNIQDNQGQTIAIGNGMVYGNGTENSNASMAVDTKYNENGNAQIIVNGDGQAHSNGANSSLTIGANADISNTYVGTALSNGAASGETNGMAGNASLNVDGGSGTGGSAVMEAWGGGKGDSSVFTNTGLTLKQWEQLRNITVNGGVSASGDRTQVNSFSMVSDKNGMQTLENSQKASSSSKGSSSASASSFTILKR
ncbi:hypothetical protein Y032_0108g38 [Ancylostoma ceylanicum]|uniref:Uncharacterized protein n=1 Tax=Ancylostoma ceylanicum TaxID=53326 RepID=A0A016TFC2_9BILA|nr:hypothetical protein Y032_0108g38 [Ancylostoma ceylanicum]